MEQSYRYKGFISYNSKDAHIAEKLQSYLEHPEILGIGENIGAFFRDRAELSANEIIKNAVYSSLEESEWLIILCSPNVTYNNNSKINWVEDECNYYINDLKRGDKCILFISPSTPKDESILKVFPNSALDIHDRLAADARENGDGWNYAVIKILSKLLGIPFGELVERNAIYKGYQNYLLSLKENLRLISLNDYDLAEEKLFELVSENLLLDFRNIEWRYILSQCNNDIGCYFFTGYITTVTMSIEAGYILLGTNEGLIYVFDALTRNKIFERKAHEGSVEKIIFKSETKIITLGQDDYVKVWSLDEEMPHNVYYKKPDLFSHLSGVFKQFYSIDKQPYINLDEEGLLVARTTGATVTVWRLIDGNTWTLRIPEIRNGGFKRAFDTWNSLSFYKDDEEWVFVCSYNNLLGWDISTCNLSINRDANADEVFLGFSSDGKLLVKKVSETEIEICHIITHKQFARIRNSEILEIDFIKCEKNNKNGYNLIMNHKQSPIYLWTLNEGDVIEKKPLIFDIGKTTLGDICIKNNSIMYIKKNVHDKVKLEYLNEIPCFMENVYSMELSSDRNYAVLSVERQEKLILLSLDNLETIAVVSEKSMFFDICFDIDIKRQLFATAGSSKQSIDIYDLSGAHLNNIPIENLHETNLMKLLKVYCTKIVFCENSKVIAGCSDGSIRIFDINEKQPKEVIKRHNCNIKFISINNVNKKMVSIDQSKKIVLWQVSEGLEYITEIVNEDDISAIDVFSNGIISIGTDNGMVKLYTPDLQLIDKWQADNCAIVSLAATSDGKRLISAGRSGSIKFWSAKSYEEILFINHNTEVEKLILNGSEKLIGILDSDNKLYTEHLILCDVNNKDGIEAWKNSRRKSIFNSWNAS